MVATWGPIIRFLVRPPNPHGSDLRTHLKIPSMTPQPPPFFLFLTCVWGVLVNSEGLCNILSMTSVWKILWGNGFGLLVLTISCTRWLTAFRRSKGRGWFDENFACMSMYVCQRFDIRSLGTQVTCSEFPVRSRLSSTSVYTVGWRRVGRSGCLRCQESKLFNLKVHYKTVFQVAKFFFLSF